MKRLCFCFTFWKKTKENIDLLEKKSLEKAAPFEHILYLHFFPPLNHGGQLYQAFPFEFLSRFLNKLG